MSFSHLTLGSGIFIGILSAAIQSVPNANYMRVYSMTVDDLGNVTADRKIRREAIADWRVSIIKDGKDGPSCSTIPGPEHHQGWSRYIPGERAARTFTMDDWAWDQGCWDRLVPGPYKMFVTWTPRDGSGPVVASTPFEKE